MTDTTYTTIKVSSAKRVGRIQLNRPAALNALNAETMEEVVSAAVSFDADPQIGAILLVFAVGLPFSLKNLRSVRTIAVPGAIPCGNRPPPCPAPAACW